MIDLKRLKVGESIEPETLSLLQPRAYEGCFAHVDGRGDIDVFLIQDQMQPWLLAFFDHDLKIAFDVFEGIALLSLRYRHYQVTFPVYDGVPTSGILHLCIIGLEGLEVLKINTHTLRSEMSDALIDAVRGMKDEGREAVYARFDTIKAAGREASMFDHGMVDILEHGHRADT